MTYIILENDGASLRRGNPGFNQVSMKAPVIMAENVLIYCFGPTVRLFRLSSIMDLPIPLISARSSTDLNGPCF